MRHPVRWFDREAEEAALSREILTLIVSSPGFTHTRFV
jgi:hypothetical protein